MPAGPCSHGARVGHGTSDIGDRVVSRLTERSLDVHTLMWGPRASVDILAPPLGSWVALARVLPSPRKRGTLLVHELDESYEWELCASLMTVMSPMSLMSLSCVCVSV